MTPVTDEPEPDPLMTTKEVARYLHVHPTTVRRWVKAGRLHAIKPGDGELRFSRAALPPINPPEGRTP